MTHLDRVLTILEVSRKQDYIFSSKKLRENADRSNEIAYVTGSEFFRESAKNLYDEQRNMVYAGGGHTVLQFDSADQAVAFTRAVTEDALRRFEGMEIFAKTLPYYRSALDVQTKRTASGSTYTIPQNVCAGYLRREGQSYKIYPTKIPYIRVSRNHPDVVLLQTKHESADNACVVKVLYQMEGERVKHISRHVEGTSVGQMMKGFLLYTGNPVGRKENHLYLFPEADADAIPLDISREDIISYTAMVAAVGRRMLPDNRHGETMRPRSYEIDDQGA